MKIDHHAEREPGNKVAIIHWGEASTLESSILIGICMIIFIPTPEADILRDIYCGCFESGLAWPYADSESCSKTTAEQLNTVWLDTLGYLKTSTRSIYWFWKQGEKLWRQQKP